MRAAEIKKFVELEDRHWWYRERRAVLKNGLRRLGPPGRAVDIGAGGGGNTRVLRDAGWEALAVDYSPEAVDFARERGLDAIQADACDLPLETGTYDLAIAFDMLEHIEHDGLAAAEIHRVLRPGGVALITVPCDMALWSAHDEACQHFRRYSKQALSELLTGAGLVVDRMWSWNVLLRPVLAMRRKSLSGSDLQRPAPIVNAGLSMIIATERVLPLGSLPGVSLMVQARRPDNT